MIRFYTLFVLLLILALAVAAPLTIPAAIPNGNPEEDRSAIIKFSHKFHVVEQGMTCDQCHAAPTSKLSSDNLLGKMADCAACHDVTDPQDCLKCHTDQERLVPFDTPPRELIFSHEAHIVGQKMACEKCHGGLEKIDLSSKANVATMASCMECHNNVKAKSTCETCHTNFTSLIPQDHRRSDFMRGHGDLVRLGSINATCENCHADAFCQQCHQGVGLKAFGPREAISDPIGRVTTKDSPNQLGVQIAHDLNYRFTHAIDARSRLSDCARCHNQQSFCGRCHEGGTVTQAGIKPASHNVAGFTTIGVGSGGGTHAQEARRDLENCMSCHDTAGSDPTCMMCHTESGRVR